MRKVILFALVGIALSIASYGVYETQSRKQTMSDILLANIEAISQWENLEECGGPAWYADVSISYGTEQTRRHLPLTNNDEIRVYQYRRCEAFGIGSLNGSHNNLGCQEDHSQVRLVTCEGDIYHKTDLNCYY